MHTEYSLLLQKLDAFIRKYYLNRLLRGTLLFVGLLVGIYLLLSVSEYQLYFSTTVRKLLLAGFGLLTAVTLYRWVLRPLFHYWKLGAIISHEQAAGIIGQHFSDVKDQLLNILQLHRQMEKSSNHELLLAGIAQKMDNIRLIPFTQAISLNANKKYLKYAVPPLLLLLILLFAAPDVLTESSTRLLQPNKTFAKKAPFEFILENTSLKVVQYDDVEVQLRIKGKTIPNEVYIKENGKSYKMEKLSNNRFSYRIANIQQSASFYFYAGEFNSDEYLMQVVKKPVLAQFSIYLEYPAYTGKQAEQLKNTGDLSVLAGTTVHWQLQTAGTEKVRIAMDGVSADATADGDGQFTFRKKILQDTRYTIYYTNSDVPQGDSVSFRIAVTPDNYPTLFVEKMQDSAQQDFALLLGAASDDYGLSRLAFQYAIRNEKGSVTESKKQTLPISSKAMSDISVQIDFTQYPLLPGYTMEYFFEAWDNDGNSGPKSTKSGVFSYEKASIKELEKLEQQNNEAINDHLSSAAKEAQKLAAAIKEMKEKIVGKATLSWEDKKQLEQLQQKHEQLTEELKDIKEKYEENLKNQSEFKEQNPEILEKQEKLQEMMNDLLSDEMKDLMKQIQDILQKMEQKNTFENLDKMDQSNKDLKSELDKMQKLFEKLQLEQKAQETIDKLNQLAKEQEQLSEQTQQKSKPAEQLQQQQEELNKKFDDIQENLQQLEELNKKAEQPMDTKENKAMSEDIEQSMDKSAKELQQQQQDKASKTQKSSSQKMQQMAQKMQMGLNQMQMDQNAEDIKMIRQLLENLVKLSFDQEQLMNDLKKTETESPKYLHIVQQQNNLRDDAKLIGDSLQALGKRQFKLQSFISDEMYKLNRELKKSITQLEARNRGVAAVAQQMVMTSSNNLALMLSESLDNLQQQQNSKKPGSGSCDKPGGKGEKPNLSEMQKKMGEQLQKMGDHIQKGGDPKKMGKDFAQAVEQQAAIREALRKMKEKMSQQQKNESGVDQLMQQMEDLEKDLITKKLTAETLKRQKEIETRMLELDKAQREQEEDDKRQSKSGIEIPRKLPASLEEYLQKRKSAMELYKSVPPDLKPFYKNLVEKYLRLVN